MARKFDNARFIFASNRSHLKLAGSNLRSIFGRQPIAATKLFRRHCFAVKFRGLRARPDKDRLAGADQRTGQFADKQVRSVRRDLLVSCIAYS